MPATAFCALMKAATRFSGSMNASSQMPRSPMVPQPRRSTLVDSTITRPAPPAANLPAFIRCQSVGKPFTAEYWCIGGTTMRLRKVTPRIVKGENNENSDMAHSSRASAADDTGHDLSRIAASTCRIVCLAPQAMQFWDGVRAPDAIREEQTGYWEYPGRTDR